MGIIATRSSNTDKQEMDFELKRCWGEIIFKLQSHIKQLDGKYYVVLVGSPGKKGIYTDKVKSSEAIDNVPGSIRRAFMTIQHCVTYMSEFGYDYIQVFDKDNEDGIDVDKFCEKNAIEPPKYSPIDITDVFEISNDVKLRVTSSKLFLSQENGPSCKRDYTLDFTLAEIQVIKYLKPDIMNAFERMAKAKDVCLQLGLGSQSNYYITIKSPVPCAHIRRHSILTFGLLPQVEVVMLRPYEIEQLCNWLHLIETSHLYQQEVEKKKAQKEKPQEA